MELPNDIRVEEALLGSLLVENGLIDVAAADLKAEDFFDAFHQSIYATMLALRQNGAVTPLVLKASLADPPLDMDVLGYLVNLSLAAPAMPKIGPFVTILRDLRARRDLISIGNIIAEDACHDRSCAVQAIIDDAADALLGIGRDTARRVLPALEVARQSIRRLEDMALGKPVALVKTGIEKLDDELGGLRGGDLVLVMGKSGMGKSALLGTLASNAARGLQDVQEHLRRPARPVIVFSLEMTREQWVERMVCDMAFEDCLRDGERALWYSRVRNGSLTPKEFERFIFASRNLEGLPLDIVDDGNLTIQQISVRARAFKAKHGDAPLGLVLIDYAQIVEPIDPRAPREQQVAGIARGAKALAKLLGWPVVIGSQMNENDASRSKEERRPQLGDARESKALGQEADIALSPYRQAYFVLNRKPMDAMPGDSAWLAWRSELKACEHRMDLLCLKNRHGRTFDLELWCDMGASAIRDGEPRYRSSQEDADLLALAGR